MSETEKALRAKAERCTRLAKACSDRTVSEALIAMAADCLERLTEMTDASVPEQENQHVDH